MYIKRNQQGYICAFSQIVEGDISEKISADSLELQNFLSTLNLPKNTTLGQSDQAMARVIEDVIHLLVEQGTIKFTDLPDAAQTKLLSRRELRGQQQGMNLLDDGDDLSI